MLARPFGLIAVLSLGLAACSGGAADDPLTPKVCKALDDAVAKAATSEPDADVMQMWVVMGIASEAGDDIAKLGAYVSKADEATQASCPDARKKVLEITGKGLLAEVIR